MSSFAIIPVLDLKHGEVVRARAGDRANYRPIISSLSPSSNPRDVLRGLRALAPFPIVYVADLDAITGDGDHHAVLQHLAEEATGVEFWLDGGFATPTAARAALPSRFVPVLGTESLGTSDDLAAAHETFGDSGFVLSLDYRGGMFLGPPNVQHRVDRWPRRVILMTLDRVGTGGGPDFAALRRLVQQAGRREVFAAGGVRGEHDLGGLKEIGVAGALVASILHDGRLPAPAIARLNR